MTIIHNSHHRLLRFASLALIILVFLNLLSSCSVVQSLASPKNASNFQLAEVLFRVSLPEEMPEESQLMLEILDDVTGLYFNASRFEMARDDAINYSIRIPLKVATELKYRYVRLSSSTEYEQNGRGQDVRFRIVRIDGPQIIDDIITGWPEGASGEIRGRITGQVIDHETNAPVPNLLISAGGNQDFTASDGSFQISDLVAGVHNLVIYSMDGSYETFQQGALIADGANTRVTVYIERRPTTNARFEVTLPRDHPAELPLRFISNLSNLGNAYTELSSGSAGSAVNYPTLTKISRNRYSIDLELPVGLHLRYKYSFGDGFWNTELSNEGYFVTRDILIQEGLVVRNHVSSFVVPEIAPVNISVKVPDATPSNEKVYLQLKPFDWTEPLPMISRGSGIWEYAIYSPLQYTDSLEYRFCRNGLCEIAGGVTNGNTRIIPLPEPQFLSSVVVEWQGLDGSVIDSSQYLAFDAMPPRPDFITGVEFAPVYVPGWRATITGGLIFSQQLGSDYVMLSPTWTVEETSLPALSIVPGQDLQWQEMMTMINHVTMSGQRTILYPKINYTQGANNFYASDKWSDEWKTAWFEQYQRFMYHNADLAQIMQVDGVVIAEPSVPFLEYGQNSIDTSAIPRAFSAEQWSKLISGIRERYDGQLMGVAVVSRSNTFIPSWLDQVDMAYVQLSPALDLQEESVSEIRKYFDSLLDIYIKPITIETGKPVVIGISYTSSISAKFGLLTSNEFQLITPQTAISYDSDLEIQAKIYSAAVQSSASRDWVKGFFSRGYYPYVELQDASSSVYKKPASEILWFWYHYLLNKAP